METAEAYLQSGDLEKSLAELKKGIRNHPEKADLRIFLFQLFSVLGQWERAMTQLNIAAEMDSSVLLMAQVYRPALNCEELRKKIFQGNRTPLSFGEPLDWMVWLMQIPGLLAAGQCKEAVGMRDKAFDAAPPVSGQIDGHPFNWIADADERLGPLLEAIINGKYYWIPFNRIQKIQIQKPVNLRDVIWAPADFTWANNGQAAGLIPTRYPGSDTEKDSALKLGRKTEWRDMGENLFVGLGQRMLATDQGEYPLLDIREVTLNQPDRASKENLTHG
ncbi:MAG: type VI secretion system accessory protein TagJ [Desulfobacteraceae bacterium]